MRLCVLILLVAFNLASHGQAADFQTLEGHGGPIKGVAVSGDKALSASFDNSVGFWDLKQATPLWLEGHTAAVNAVAFVDGGRVASGGDDMTVRLWDIRTRTSGVFEGHTGKIMNIDVSPDGEVIASASWDGTVRLWDVLGGTDLDVLEGHDGSVNDVAFARDGTVLYSVSYDGTVREWDVQSGQTTRILARHGFGINTLALDEAGGWLAYGALDGGTRIVDLSTEEVLADLTLDRRPILSMARSPDGAFLAVGDGEGFIMLVSTADWSIQRDFRAAVRGPVWALAFSADSTRLLAGGIDDRAYVWPLEGGAPVEQMGSAERTFLNAPETMENGERQFARKCSICHTLSPDGARRAGPSLYGLFGRQAGTLDGYTYSQALLDADFAWSEDTVDKLFDLGPDHFTPGSKMPMQRIVRVEDRADLIAYLKRMTEETTR